MPIGILYLWEFHPVTTHSAPLNLVHCSEEARWREIRRIFWTFLFLHFYTRRQNFFLSPIFLVLSIARLNHYFNTTRASYIKMFYLKSHTCKNMINEENHLNVYNLNQGNGQTIIRMVVQLRHRESLECPVWFFLGSRFFMKWPQLCNRFAMSI